MVTDRPNVFFIPGKSGKNMDVWVDQTKTKGREAWGTRAIFWIIIGDPKIDGFDSFNMWMRSIWKRKKYRTVSNGWELIGDWRWKKNSEGIVRNYGEHKDEEWGSKKEKGKISGYVPFDEVGNLEIIFTVEGDFRNIETGETKTFGFEVWIDGILDLQTGLAKVSDTILLDEDIEPEIDDIDPDPEPDPDPQPDPEPDPTPEPEPVKPEPEKPEIKKSTIGQWIDGAIAWFMRKWWIWLLLGIGSFVLHIVRC